MHHLTTTRLLFVATSLLLPTIHSQKDDAVYAVGVPFDIDGVLTQVPVLIHAGESAQEAVATFCVTERPNLCVNADAQLQILDIVTNTISIQRERLYPNLVLRTILEAKQVIDAAGKAYRLDSNVAPDEGLYLYDLIKQYNMTKTLEVGMAYGVSALYIAQAHHEIGLHQIKLPTGHANDETDSSHVVIDPFQSTQWNSIGSLNLMRAHLRQYVRLLEQESHFALPHLVMHEKGTYQLCFIDGMHLFDYTLVDFYYSDLLLMPHGFMIFDDAHMPSVQKVIAHALTNRAYVQIDNGLNNQRVVTLQKVSDDDRKWDFHVDAF